MKTEIDWTIPATLFDPDAWPFHKATEQTFPLREAIEEYLSRPASYRTRCGISIHGDYVPLVYDDRVVTTNYIMTDTAVWLTERPDWPGTNVIPAS